MNAVRIAAGVTCLVALAACTSNHHATPTTPAPTSPTTTPAPTVNPLTGQAPSNNAVVAVKIDDTAAGRPQSGLDKADIVYIEQVEGGLTRLLALFNTHLPTVAPVRSTRVGDPDIVAQFGPVVFVASGGAGAALKALDASPLRSAIEGRGAAGFARDPSRSAPYNLSANLTAIAARLKGPKAKDFGLKWSGKVTNTGSVAGATVKTRVGGTPVMFTWDAKVHRYVRVINGAVQKAADHNVISTPNVVVQFCKVTTFPGDVDVAGNPAKITQTIGTGKVAVFRDGRRIDGTWHRASGSAGTTLTDAHGAPITLAPGGAWFVLAATGTPLS